MREVEAFYIPSQLDEPERLLFWSLDEAMLMLIPTWVGIALGYILIGLIVGIIAFISWKRIKGAGQVNLAIYSVYWFFPHFLSALKFTPPSYQRFYLG